MLDELDLLVLNHKRGEDELRRENQLLRIKLEKAMNALDEQISGSQIQKSQFEMSILEKES